MAFRSPTAAAGAKMQGGSVLLRVRFPRTSGRIGESMNEDSSGVGLIARTSIKFSNRLGRGDSSERMEVRACRCLPAIAEKIVGADIDQDDFPPAPLPIRDLLRLQIMESVFSLAARRTCVAVGTSLPARAGELKTDWTRPPAPYPGLWALNGLVCVFKTR